MHARCKRCTEWVCRNHISMKGYCSMCVVCKDTLCVCEEASFIAIGEDEPDTECECCSDNAEFKCTNPECNIGSDGIRLRDRRLCEECMSTGTSRQTCCCCNEEFIVSAEDLNLCVLCKDLVNPDHAWTCSECGYSVCQTHAPMDDRMVCDQCIMME